MSLQHITPDRTKGYAMNAHAFALHDPDTAEAAIMRIAGMAWPKDRIAATLAGIAASYEAPGTPARKMLESFARIDGIDRRAFTLEQDYFAAETLAKAADALLMETECALHDAADAQGVEL